MSTAVGLFGLAANPMLKLLAYITAEGSIGAVWGQGVAADIDRVEGVPTELGTARAGGYA